MIWASEQVFVLSLLLSNKFLSFFWILDSLDSFCLQYTYGTASTHHSDLSVWPCVAYIAAELLTAHHDVATTVRLTDSYSYLRYSSLTESKHQFCSVIDDTSVLLTCTAEETRNVHEGKDLDIKCVAETNEASSLTTSVAVQYTCQPVWLVSDDTGRTAVETCETADDVLSVVFLNLHEVAIIYDSVDDVFHVVWFVRIIWNDLVQALLYTHWIIGAVHEWSLLHIVLWDEANETTNLCQCLFLSSCYEVSNTRLGCVHFSTTELLYGYVLTSNALHYLRTSDEHV